MTSSRRKFDSAGSPFARGGTSPNFRPSRCFVAGTLVHTANRLVTIEKVKTGDKVLSYNEGERQVEYQTVVKTFVNHSSNLFEVKVEGQSEPLVVTNGHPFYVHRARSNLPADEGEWIASDKLVAGDLLLKPDGTWVKVLFVNHVFGEAAVYNFEVEQNHDYFVGQVGVLVHNQGSCDLVSEGIYEFTSSSGRTYVGQSNDITRRMGEHIRSGKLFESELPNVKRTEVLGGKTSREIAEQLRINGLGGIGNLENRLNPIGPGRQYLLPQR